MKRSGSALASIFLIAVGLAAAAALIVATQIS